MYLNEIKLNFCFSAKYYRFNDEVYIFPNVSDEMIVSGHKEVSSQCESFAGASLISITSYDLQQFLAAKLNEVYLQYSGILLEHSQRTYTI